MHARRSAFDARSEAVVLEEVSEGLGAIHGVLVQVFRAADAHGDQCMRPHRQCPGVRPRGRRIGASRHECWLALNRKNGRKGLQSTLAVGRFSGFVPNKIGKHTLLVATIATRVL
jgi:hypothetical protein